MGKLSQQVVVIQLKIYLDLLDDPKVGRSAQRNLLRVLQEGDVATNHVLRNIGAKRKQRLMEFLKET